MLNSYQRFKDNVRRLHNMEAIYQYLNNVVRVPSADIDDILRNQLTSLISSLDKFVHDVVRVGMIESYFGRRTITDAFLRFHLSLKIANMLKDPTIPDEVILTSHINMTNGYLAFQDPDKISSALALIWEEKYKWQKIAEKLGDTEANVKVKLKNLVMRRNQIVHESDVDLSTGIVQPVIYTDIRSAITFVDQVVDAIYALVN